MVRRVHAAAQSRHRCMRAVPGRRAWEIGSAAGDPGDKGVRREAEADTAEDGREAEEWHSRYRRTVERAGVRWRQGWIAGRAIRGRSSEEADGAGDGGPGDERELSGEIGTARARRPRDSRRDAGATTDVTLRFISRF